MTPPPAADDEASSAPVWTAAAVARRLDVAPATLRSWSARYGIGPIDHRAGRYRRYSGTDVAELDTMRRLRDQGVPMATAASLARERRLRGSASDDGVYWADAATALEHAARGLDADAALRVLDTAFTDGGVVATWDRLCRPALARTSLAAADGHPDPDEGCIDAECVLTWAITTSLRRRPPSPPVPAARRVLLACATGELHTLALDALFAALDEHQVPVRMLGPSVPAPALLHAAEQTRPTAVFVWAQSAHTASPAVLRRLGRYADVVVAAGPGWEQATLPRRIPTTNSLHDAVRRARGAATRPATTGASSSCT